MPLLLIVVLVAFAAITVYDASAQCSDPHCYATTTTGITFGSEFQGLRYNIEIPDLYIDEQACEEMGAVVTGWVHLEQSNVQEQWIENGITVGWIDPPDSQGRCVTIESAYYAYSRAFEEDERIYIEDITDPHGDTIGIEKRFAIEKNNSGTWNLYYGDRRALGLIPPSPLNFEADRVLNIDFGAEGTISPVTQYSTIPSTRITEAQYKDGNTWMDVPTGTTTLENVREGYSIDVCAPGTFGAGAATLDLPYLS